MEITKEAAVKTAGTPSPQQLEAINRLTKSPLSPEQVYVFSLRLCDDQPDRDYERFDREALPRLAELFVGKTGIMDHKWAAGGQVARIFAAQAVTEDEVSYIKAWAYIRRSPETQSLIGDIEAGIKKEVSVGCAMGGAVCSVCGEEYGACSHVKGQTYGDKTCYAVLTDPKDAYEFSFVAVPAQRQAGVLKAKNGGAGLSLKALVEKEAGPAAAAEFYRLSKQAELGDRFRQELRRKTVRLCLALDLGIRQETLEAVAEKLTVEELEGLSKALARREAELYPVTTQLPRDPGPREETDGGFLI